MEDRNGRSDHRGICVPKWLEVAVNGLTAYGTKRLSADMRRLRVAQEVLLFVAVKAIVFEQ